MGETTILYGLLVALAMGVGALAIFIWSVLSGQLDDIEDAKHRFLERELDDEKG